MTGNGPVYLLGLFVLVVFAAWYIMRRDAMAAAAAASTPGALIGSGVGNLVSGIVGFATGSGGSRT